MEIQTAQGQKTINQQYLLQLLFEKPTGGEAKSVQAAMFTMYVDEFGLGWVYKELAEARENVMKLKLKDFRAKAIATAVESLVSMQDKKGTATDDFWIGTKQVGLRDYCVYCKGLYWLAGYDLLNNR